MKTNFNYREVPQNYLHCMNEQCSRSAECLRFQVSLLAGEDDHYFLAINSRCMSGKKECPYFQPDYLVKYASGITHLFANVPYDKAMKIKRLMLRHFEHSTFHRIRCKIRLITPEEQALIKMLFEKEGIREEPVYDEYIEQYEFVSLYKKQTKREEFRIARSAEPTKS